MIVIGCDLETTGLDECQDEIVEIALVAIETPSFQIVDRYETVIYPTVHGRARLDANAFVLEMHHKSGLLKALDDAAEALRTEPGAIRPRDQRPAFVEEAEREALAFFHKHMGSEKSPMFGANPKFDRGFMKTYLPDLAKAFTYRDLDINSLWLLRQYISGEDPTAQKREQAHRAMADCERAVATVHEHFDWMQVLLKAVA